MTDRVSDLSAAELLERAAKLAGWDEGNLPVTLHFVDGVVRCETVEAMPKPPANDGRELARLLQQADLSR